MRTEVHSRDRRNWQLDRRTDHVLWGIRKPGVQVSYTVSRGRKGCSQVDFASVSYLQCVTAASRLWRVKTRQDKTSQGRTSQVERQQHDRSVCECDAMGIVEPIVSENF